jgi:hypothetical protein
LTQLSDHLPSVAGEHFLLGHQGSVYIGQDEADGAFILCTVS